MYELIDIDPKLITLFYKTIEKAYSKENWHSIFLVAVKNALHTVDPQSPSHILDAYIKRSIRGQVMLMLSSVLLIILCTVA